jgi:hypothetical protein
VEISIYFQKILSYSSIQSSFGVDQKLPLGFVLSSEITYNDNISAVTYENLNIKAASSNLTGADTRPRYNGRNNRVDQFRGIYLGSNTSEGKAYNVAFTLAKNFRSLLMLIFWNLFLENLLFC